MGRWHQPEPKSNTPLAKLDTPILDELYMELCRLRFAGKLGRRKYLRRRSLSSWGQNDACAGLESRIQGCLRVCGGMRGVEVVKDGGHAIVQCTEAAGKLAKTDFLWCDVCLRDPRCGKISITNMRTVEKSLHGMLDKVFRQEPARTASVSLFPIKSGLHPLALRARDDAHPRVPTTRYQQ